MGPAGCFKVGRLDFEELNNAATDSERADVAEEQDNVEVLLAFLWASERGLLSPVKLGDMEESPHLNHQCELLLNKIRTPVKPQAGTSRLGVWANIGCSQPYDLDAKYGNH
jgi:hypothetical protein